MWSTLSLEGMATPEVNVLIFGETGVGKSSVVNMALGRQAAETNDEARGCTIMSAKYEQVWEGVKYNFYDSVGLGESLKGRVPKDEAIQHLVYLLKRLNKEGLHLLVLVIRKGRVKDVDVKNFDIFANSICEKKVPTLLCVTHCDADYPLDNWKIKNKAEVERQDIKACDIVCVCAERNGTNFGGSRQKFYQALYKYALLEPYKREDIANAFTFLMKRYWNDIFGWIGKFSLSEALTDLYLAMNYDLATAKELANKTAIEFSSIQ